MVNLQQIVLYKGNHLKILLSMLPNLW